MSSSLYAAFNGFIKKNYSCVFLKSSVRTEMTEMKVLISPGRGGKLSLFLGRTCFKKKQSLCRGRGYGMDRRPMIFELKIAQGGNKSLLF